MDRLKQIESFVAVATKGSLTAAAQADGLAPAVVGRRIDALEQRLGVKLLLRTTRRISLTHEGSAFLEDCQRLLADLANAEASVSEGGVKASGHLRITAPAGFGRRHVAPLVPGFLAQHPEVSLSLNLSDRVVDIVNESYDCAVRVGDLPDSTLVGVRLADNRRMCVATPAYLQRAGTPAHPDDLAKHQCLSLSSDASQSRGWAFTVDGQVQHLRPTGRLDCSDGQVLHAWCAAGLGLAWRSTWEVEAEVAAGTLVSVLDDFAAPPNGIYAVFAHAKHLPLRVRLWIDFIKHSFGDPGLLVERGAQVTPGHGLRPATRMKKAGQCPAYFLWRRGRRAFRPCRQSLTKLFLRSAPLPASWCRQPRFRRSPSCRRQRRRPSRTSSGNWSWHERLALIALLFSRLPCCTRPSRSAWRACHGAWPAKAEQARASNEPVMILFMRGDSFLCSITNDPVGVSTPRAIGHQRPGHGARAALQRGDQRPFDGQVLRRDGVRDRLA